MWEQFLLEKIDNRHVSFNLEYFKTYNRIPLSVDVFADGLPNSANLTMKMFYYFIQNHLIQFELYFKTWLTKWLSAKISFGRKYEFDFIVILFHYLWKRQCLSLFYFFYSFIFVIFYALINMIEIKLQLFFTFVNNE